mmetsp:Transcript_38504/g.100007  ORF Transcript_38504/g.100007 Transcript_38504/m.100007 type:complete len:483 (-) Transcript_38504:129-1577(-)
MGAAAALGRACLAAKRRRAAGAVHFEDACHRPDVQHRAERAAIRRRVAHPPPRKAQPQRRDWAVRVGGREAARAVYEKQRPLDEGADGTVALERMFARADADGDGALSMGELGALLAERTRNGALAVQGSDGKVVYTPLEELVAQYAGDAGEGEGELRVDLQAFCALMRDTQDGLAAEYSRGKLAYEIFIAAFAVVVMAINAVEMLIPDSLTQSTIHTVDQMLAELILKADTYICAAFGFDFLYRHFLSSTATARTGGDRWYRNPGLLASMAIEILTVIPMSVASSLAWARGLHTFRLVRVFRLLRLLSAARCLQDSLFLRSQRRAGAALAILFTSVSTGLLGAIGVLVFEGAADGGTIRSAGDALWWALTTMTTVGYGDFAPVTHGGKVVAGALMLVGVSIFGSVSGLIGSLILQNDEPAEEGKATPEQGGAGRAQPDAEVAALRGEMAALRGELAEVKALLLQRDARPGGGGEGGGAKPA